MRFRSDFSAQVADSQAELTDVVDGLDQPPGPPGAPAAQAPGADLPAATIRTRVRVPVRAGDEDPWDGAEVITFAGLIDGREHLAIAFPGTAEVPLVRVHSECLTGDVLGSARCDCGPQLHEAMTLFADGGGVILYLRQEGRGIGLYNKLDAYRLQDEGLDTFAANRALAFADDLRDYRPAAQMLRALGLDSVRLLTNNGDKVAQLTAAGIRVAAIQPTQDYANEFNGRYLTAKRDRVEYATEGSNHA
ncbi:MAG TPA: GTP cyclohydrolase II [Jatrophihabitans sp.]|nr:GTP cyclohydrolase II [Jatrophihabitans sp.]